MDPVDEKDWYDVDKIVDTKSMFNFTNWESIKSCYYVLGRIYEGAESTGREMVTWMGWVISLLIRNASGAERPRESLAPPPLLINMLVWYRSITHPLCKGLVRIHRGISIALPL